MKSSSSPLRRAILVASVIPVAFACSDSEVDDRALGGRPDAADAVFPDAHPAQDDATTSVDAATDAWIDADAAQPQETMCSVENWCHLVVPDAQTLNAVWGDGQGAVWTVSSQGQILRWEGDAWVKSYPEAGGGPALYTIWGSSPTDLWVGGDTILLHGTGTSPATLTWSNVELPPSEKVRPNARKVRSLWGASATSIWAAVNDGSRAEVLHYVPTSLADAGADGSWVIEPFSHDQDVVVLEFSKVWGTGPDDVWVGGTEFGKMAPFQRRPNGDGTYTWIRRNYGWNQFTCDYAFIGARSLSPSNVYLLGQREFCIGVSGNGGADFEWTRKEFPSANTNNTDAWGTGPDNLWMVSEFGRLRHWNGAEWRTARVALDDSHPLVKHLYGIWGGGPDDIWVVGDGVALHKRAP